MLIFSDYRPMKRSKISPEQLKTYFFVISSFKMTGKDEKNRKKNFKIFDFFSKKSKGSPFGLTFWRPSQIALKQNFNIQIV